MNRSLFETLVGFLIVIFAVCFTYYAYNKAEKLSSSDNYTLKAKFDHADGINIGSEVRISGIKVGEVVARNLDPNSYRAEIVFNIQNNIKIPNDSSAQILSDGLLGQKFIGIIPGAEDEFLTADGEILYTQSSVSLETLIGKMIFSKNDNDKKEDNKQQKNTEKAKSHNN